MCRGFNNILCCSSRQYKSTCRNSSDLSFNPIIGNILNLIQIDKKMKLGDSWEQCVPYYLRCEANARNYVLVVTLKILAFTHLALSSNTCNRHVLCYVIVMWTQFHKTVSCPLSVCTPWKRQNNHAL